MSADKALVEGDEEESKTRIQSHGGQAEKRKAVRGRSERGR